MRSFRLFLSLTAGLLIFVNIHPGRNHKIPRVALATVFQDEAPYLVEWIEFYKLIGVEFFYLYNNLSSDNYLEVLAPYIGKEVEIIEWPYTSEYGDHKGWLKLQKRGFVDACNRAAGNCDWLVVVDTDEFLFPVERDTLPEFLQEFGPDCGQILVSWLLYGTSHVPEIAQGKLLIEMLTLRSRLDYSRNNMVKSIVRPEAVRNYHSAHFADLHPGYISVLSDQTPFLGIHPPVNLYNKVRINHYWTRAENYLEKKIERRKRHGGDVKALIKRAKKLNAQEDRAIFKYVDRLKRAMKLF